MDKVTALRATVVWDGMDAVGGRRRRLIGTARSQEGPPMRFPVCPLHLPHTKTRTHGAPYAPVVDAVIWGKPG
jgi:hypothetical protein